MKWLTSPRAPLIWALVYFVFPLDLVPDIFGPLGRIDDLAILAFALWRIYRAIPAKGSSTKQSERPLHKATQQTDPYELFKLSPGASREEIDTRYKELAKDYHPDRVAHLGEDLRAVAHEKMIEIQRAYEVLTKA